MSRSKSQLKSKSAVRTSTAGSIAIDLEDETPSSVSTRTRDSFKSAFFNFMRDFKQKHTEKDYQFVMRLGSRRWHSMTQADRAPYVLEAARNRRTAKPNSQSDKKKQNAREKKSDKRCPACGHRKSSRERRSHSDSHSSHSSHSRSSRSTKSKTSRHSKK